MSSSYLFKEYNYEDPIFHNVDATYIIHLEGNGRLANIKNQLFLYHPTSKVFIVFNKGFKNSKKEDHVNTPAKDLIDVFYTIFKDARSKGFQNILILEDDFIFNTNISEREHSNKIDHFLEKNITNNFIYYLGTLCYLQSGFGETHPRVVFSTGTHACIYSKKCIDYFLDNVDQKSINDWDICLNFGTVPRFKYYMPLCYQTFPDTDNSRGWHRGSTLLFFIVWLQRSLLCKILGLDVSYEPGFSNMEFVSRLLFWIIVLAILYSTYKIIFNKNK